MRDYLWASPAGSIRIIEKSLLTKADLTRVLEADSLEGALSALRDTYYGPFVLELSSPDSFEAALLEALKDAHNEMMKNAPEPLVLAAYRGRYDFHNLKVHLKARLLGTEANNVAFSGLGVLSPGEVAQILEAARLGEGLAKLESPEPGPFILSAYAVGLEIYEACARINGLKDRSDLSPFEVDGLADKAYYAWAERVLRKHGYEALVQFFKSEIDILNLKMAFRAKRLGMSNLDFEKVTLTDGTIDSNHVNAAYAEGSGSIYALYKGSELEGLAKRGLALLEKEEPLTLWEKECDNAVTRIMKKAGTISLGPEPIFGYVFGREIEVRNLRIILSGKQALVPENEILERLRESYA